MVVIGICDDEKHYRSIIRKYLEKILQSNVQSYEIYEFTSGEELLENYPNNLDILILDIKMDSIDGEYIFINDMKIPVSRYRTKGLKLAITNTLGDIVC